MSSQVVISSWRLVSSASAGTTPSSFCRAMICSRNVSHPLSNLPLHLSDHSLGTWCGAWVAPGAQYMKNGLSGTSAFCAITWVRQQKALGPVHEERFVG